MKLANLLPPSLIFLLKKLNSGIKISLTLSTATMSSKANFFALM